jgi:hypothetical protein
VDRRRVFMRLRGVQMDEAVDALEGALALDDRELLFLSGEAKLANDELAQRDREVWLDGTPRLVRAHEKRRVGQEGQSL